MKKKTRRRIDAALAQRWRVVYIAYNRNSNSSDKPGPGSYQWVHVKEPWGSTNS